MNYNLKPNGGGPFFPKRETKISLLGQQNYKSNECKVYDGNNMQANITNAPNPKRYREAWQNPK